MTNDRPSELLGALPRTRPHRRSAKRPARADDVAGSQRDVADARKAPASKSAKPKAAAPTPAKPKAAASAPAKPKAAAPAPAKPNAAAPAAAKAKAAAPTTKRVRPASPPRAKRLAQPAQPRGVPSAGRAKRPLSESGAPTDATPILGTAVQAAAELAEIGLALGTRALRRAIDRFPRP